MSRTRQTLIAGATIAAIALLLAASLTSRRAADQEHPLLATAALVEPVQPPPTGRQPHLTPVCARSPQVIPHLLRIMDAAQCETADPSRLRRIGADITIPALALGDLDGLWNLPQAVIAAGDRHNPLPPNLFRDLRAVNTISIATAGNFQPETLNGLTLLRHAYLANGYNAIHPPGPDLPRAPAEATDTSSQQTLPPNLLCGSPWLAQLSLWTPAEVPAEMFDCVPRITRLELGNATPDGQNAAPPYPLDLRRLHNLQELRAPALPGSNRLRPALLSPQSPLYRAKAENARPGPADCPRYIAGEGWTMCLN